MTGLFQVPHAGAILVQCTKRAGVGFYSPPRPRLQGRFDTLSQVTLGAL